MNNTGELKLLFTWFHYIQIYGNDSHIDCDILRALLQFIWFEKLECAKTAENRWHTSEYLKHDSNFFSARETISCKSTPFAIHFNSLCNSLLSHSSMQFHKKTKNVSFALWNSRNSINNNVPLISRTRLDFSPYYCDSIRYLIIEISLSGSSYACCFTVFVFVLRNLFTWFWRQVQYFCANWSNEFLRLLGDYFGFGIDFKWIYFLK